MKTTIGRKRLLSKEELKAIRREFANVEVELKFRQNALTGFVILVSSVPDLQVPADSMSDLLQALTDPIEPLFNRACELFKMVSEAERNIPVSAKAENHEKAA